MNRRTRACWLSAVVLAGLGLIGFTIVLRRPDAPDGVHPAQPEVAHVVPSEISGQPSESRSFVEPPVFRVGDAAAARAVLDHSLSALDPEQTLVLRLTLVEPCVAERVLAVFPSLREVSRSAKTLRCEGTRTGIEAFLAAVPEGVTFVEADPVAVLYNTVAGGTRFLGVGPLREVSALNGRGEVIAVIDTGISTGVAASFHKDLLPGLFGMTVEPSVPNAATLTPADTNGHGSHVAGSVVSRGLSYPETRGSAPGAVLFFQRVGVGTALYTQNEVSEHFARSVSVGASVISCSWGHMYASVGYYDSLSADVDAFVWNNPETLICFAVGNDGRDRNKDNVIDASSVYSLEAHAKNILTVGAQESYRPSDTRTYNAYSSLSGQLGATLAGDRHASPFDGAHDGMAAFSSRGPLNDGRVAPMLVAPGTAIVSTVMGGASGSMSGTSMATPLTAGSAAVFRQYLREAHGISAPTAALLRAGLILCAESLSPGQYGTGSTREIPAESPNNVEGWGALRLGRHLSGEATLGFSDRISLTTGESKTFTIKDVQAGSELVAVLSWIDASGVLRASSTNLVNDYDLTLTDPDGVALTLGDHLNPIERLRIASAKAGDYTLTVSAHAIWKDGTGNLAALAWRARTAAGPVALPKAVTPVSSETVTLTVVPPTGAEPYLSFPLFPAPGSHVYPKGSELTVRGAPWLSKTSASARVELAGWVLRKADGTFQKGIGPLSTLTLDQDATLRWYTAFPGFGLSVR